MFYQELKQKMNVKTVVSSKLLIALLVICSVFISGCANTDKFNEINLSEAKLGAMDYAAVGFGISNIKDKKYGHRQHKEEVEKILGSKGFCVEHMEGLLSEKGEITCSYFGFASEITVRYDQKNRVTSANYQNIIPGMQIITIAVNWLMQ